MGMLTGKGKHKAKAGNHPYTNTSKPENVRRGEYRCKILEIHCKLSNQQLKQSPICIDSYIKTSWELQTKNLQ